MNQFDTTMTMTAAWAFGVSLLAGLVLTPLARAAAVRAGALDRPDGRRKLHLRPVPLWGGVAVFLALTCGLAVSAWWAFIGSHSAPQAALSAFNSLSPLLLSALLLCVVGCLDDGLDLPPRVKLLFQAAAVSPVVAGTQAVERLSIIGWSADVSSISALVLLFWLLASINALNLLDGLDGLASSFGIVAALAAVCVAAEGGHLHAILPAIALAGALSAFLVFNLPPATIYLGDSGSMVIGLVLGFATYQGARTGAGTVSVLLPLAVMTVPLLDSVLAVIRRRLSGRRFDSADRSHLHHRLMERGLGPWRVVLLVAALAAATGSAAVYSTILNNDTVALLTVTATISLLIATRTFGHHELALARLAAAHAWAQGLERFALRKSPPAHPQATVLHGITVNSHRERGGSLARDELPFELLWPDMVRIARGYCVRGLEATVMTDQTEPLFHRRWETSDTAKTAAIGWKLEMTFSGPERRTCVIRIFGNHAEFSQQIAVARLIAVLKPYGEALRAVRPTGTQDDSSPRRQAA